MKAIVPPIGKYVVAVSGGVDSIVGLHWLAQQAGLELVVAHVDHGMRPSSHEDATFVRQLADTYGARFEAKTLALGSGASEQLAREHRYEFLHRVANTHQAAALITFHHQDDVLETIIINCLRGTGWRGLSSLRSHDRLLRPFINVPKAEVWDYAHTHNLQWREDSTNVDLKYLRNYVRHTIAPRVPVAARQQLLGLWAEQSSLGEQIRKEVDILLPRMMTRREHQLHLSRYWLTMVPSVVADELIRAAMLMLGTSAPLPAQRRQLIYFAKVARPGSRMRPQGNYECHVTERALIVGLRQT